MLVWPRMARPTGAPAINRQVYEEVGYDIGPLLKQDVFLEHVEHEHPIRLYIIPNVPETTAFQTLTRKEISVRWRAATSQQARPPPPQLTHGREGTTPQRGARVPFWSLEN